MSRERDRDGSEPREERERSEEPRRDEAQEFKCFVGGISWSMSDADLKDLFRKFNPREATVMVDKNTGRSRGFGFVIFTSRTDMEEAIRRYHDTEVDNRKISVRHAVPQAETAPGTPASALAQGRRMDRNAQRGGGGYGGDRGGHRGGGGGGGYYDDRYRRDPYPRGGPYERPGYDRGYPPPAYGGGYGYDSRGGYDYYGRDPYGSRGGYGAYPPPAGYDAYGGGDRYSSGGGGGERGGYSYSSGTGERYGGYPPADRGQAYPPAAGGGEYPPRGGGGPDRGYGGGYGGGSGRPGPYDRSR